MKITDSRKRDETIHNLTLNILFMNTDLCNTSL